MSLERLIDQTRERFPQHHESKVEILPLEKRGLGPTLLSGLLQRGSFLDSRKVQPGKTRKRTVCGDCLFSEWDRGQRTLIYYHDQDQSLIWMQDLGGSLWHQERPWAPTSLL